MIVRKVKTNWTGGLHGGNGQVLHGGLRNTFSFASRFQEEPPATSPEELLAAAHGACFSMALAGALEAAGFPLPRLEVTVNVLFDDQTSPEKIRSILLQVVGKAPGINEAAFIAMAKDAKVNCPLSQALRGVEINLEATLAAGDGMTG